MLSLYSRANLKRWSELVAKKKQEIQQQKENEAIEEVKVEKQEDNEEKEDETKSKDNSDSLNEAPSVNDEKSKLQTLVDRVKTEALADHSFSSDDE